MRNIFTLILFTLFFLQQIISQVNIKNKEFFLEAEYYLLYEDYAEALPLYQKIYDHENPNANLDYRIGVCYLNTPNEKDKAIPFLEKAVKNISRHYREGSFKETRAPLNALLYLANAYRINNQLDEAINTYQEFKDQLTPKDVFNIDFVEQQIRNCNNAKELINSPIIITKTNPGENFNNRFDNTNCVFSGDGNTMVYTSKLKFYDAIFYSIKENGTWAFPKNITPQLRSEGKCYTTSLSYNGKTLFIFMDDNYGGDIYVSHFSDEKSKWGYIEKLNKNINTRFWETSACISPDGKTLYFSSDRKGGYGGLDIYMSTIDEGTNDWGEAVNLGSVVNTPLNEESPYILDGDVLYFSSQGHFNMGGYDIFYVKNMGENKWSEPLNMGYPINTTDDDLFFFPLQDGVFAYHSDFDENGFGGRDILLIEIFSDKNPFKYTLKGQLTLQDNKQQFPKDKFQVSIINAENNENIETIKPDTETGMFSFKILSGNYTVNFKGEGYKEKNKQLYIPINYSSKEITLNAELEPKEINPEEFVVIKSIFFNFDDNSLTREALIEIERLYQLMTKYPSLYIEVTGHCDSHGTYKYNLDLSKKRARAVIDYISGKGISPDRFVATAAGESNPIAKNKNTDGSDNPEGRKFNRRVDIKILKSDNRLVITESDMVPQDLKYAGDVNYTILLTKEEKKLPEKYFDKFPELNTSNIKSVFSGKEYIYTTGNFKNKSDAIELLNQAIDSGFENAEIIDTDEVDDIVKSYKLSEQDKQKYTSGIYTIQLLATKIKMNLAFFRNMSNVKEVKGADNFYRYIYGRYKSREEAKTQLEKIIEQGYTDAFIMNIEKYE